MTTLGGKVAVVTGASRGIGLAAAAELSRRGAHVVITGRDAGRLEDAMRSVGLDAVPFAADVAEDSAAARCVDRTLDRFGRVDILVNNAGVSGAPGRLVDQPRDAFVRLFTTNTWGPVTWAGAVWRGWMNEHGGSIVNVASIGGLTVGPNIGVYCASKAALIHLTRQLAHELAPRVRVNSVAPGLVRTRFSEALWRERETEAGAATPLARIGEPRDIAAAIAFLAGDDAAWITGETLVIDGGHLLGAPEPELEEAR